MQKQDKIYLQKDIFVFCVTVRNEPGSEAEYSGINQVRNRLCKSKGDSIDGCFTQTRPETTHVAICNIANTANHIWLLL